MDIQCPQCGNRRHLQQPDGRTTRCPACFFVVFDQWYIQQGLKQRDLRYPADLDAVPPWDAADRLLVCGPLRRFQLMAWRSLAPHRERRLEYEYLTLARVVDIHFDRALGRFEDRGALHDCPLLIVIAGTEVKTDFTAEIFLQLLGERDARGLGLWLHSLYPPAAMGTRYGTVLQDALPPLVPLP